MAGAFWGNVWSMSDEQLAHRLDDGEPVPARNWRQLVTEGVLALPHLVALVARLMRDRRVPLRRKALVGAAVAYAISPIDFLPDLVPILGKADDLVLLAFSVHHLLEAAPPDVRAEYWRGSEDALALVAGVVAWGAELVPARLRKLIAG